MLYRNPKYSNYQGPYINLIKPLKAAFSEACYQALGLHESLRKHMSQTWIPYMNTRDSQSEGFSVYLDPREPTFLRTYIKKL